jgi:hypothetical protein
MKRYRNFVTKG